MTGMERFPLEYPNPQSRAMQRIVLVAAAVLLPGHLIYSMFAGDLVLFLILTVFLVFVLVTTYVRYGWMYRGHVALDGDGITIDARTARQFYLWEDVREVGVMRFGEKGGLNARWARFCGIDLDQPFAEIRLSRRPRMPLLSWRWRDEYRTDRIGVPIPTRDVIVPVADLERFLDAARNRPAIG